ncbi:hypothetical protein B0H14DRAFT_3489657 [Mycena olivaceomarginata]|nr:hypothetical protein B0H14DRAFT_3489657 [Mycena olivaceomarginata]
MDSYFKILRAWEEIQQLNIEIKCVVTWIDDEARFLRKKEEELKRTDPPPHCLGLPISPTQQRSDVYHMHQFWALAKVPGFTGSVAQTAASGRSAMGVDELDEMDEIVVEEGIGGGAGEVRRLGG